jgi:hypothetical protein
MDCAVNDVVYSWTDVELDGFWRPLSADGSFQWLDVSRVRALRFGLTLEERERLAMVKLTIWR